MSEVGGQDRLHVAIIMDGNGRWAARRGLPRTAGHRAGADAVQRVVEAAPALGITTLTLFAFSSDNWRRPRDEVAGLMSLLRRYLRAELARLIENGVRLTVIGRRDRLPDGLADEIADAERRSASGTQPHLRIAIDYSARDAIATAAAAWRLQRPPTRDEFRRLLENWDNWGQTPIPNEGAIQGEIPNWGQTPIPPTPDVDLVIRTSGEKRLSDFLLWECAYAELCFVDALWPDFGAADLRAALADFHRRERRFGGLGDDGQLTAAE
jgi:undecaprenyl diphosphate synthase